MSMAADGSRSRPQLVGPGTESSSPGLSSPPSPHSPTNAITPNAAFDRHTPIVPSQYADGPGDGGGGENRERGLAKTNATKKPRKKREPKIKSENANKSSTATATDGKEPGTKVRKARGPSGTTSSSTTTVGRKKKTIDPTESRFGQGQHLPRHTQITTTHPPPSSLPLLALAVPATLPSQPQNGNHEAIARSTTTDAQSIMPPVVPRSTSGQNYDPIRSSTIGPRSVSPPVAYSVPPRSATPPRPPAPRFASASASPSIASLIDAPTAKQANLYPHPPKHALAVTAPSSPTAKRPRLSPPAPIHPLQPKASHDEEPLSTAVPASVRNAAGGNDADRGLSRAPSGRSTALVPKPSRGTSTGPPSTSHSPKPSRPREPPVPSGNGLLSSAIFGGSQDETVPGKSGATVILHVPLNGCTNKVVNFAEMAEKKYGFDAVYPRLAAQRKRLAKVAAAGAALENAHKGARQSGSGMSADEMSVDISDGIADDSNVEMGGTVGYDRDGNALRPSGSEGKKVPKKRMMKEDQYDKDDPFVDDTELAWEEQAAASRDGFFVYSGPLVPEGEKVVVERADGGTKRGRGKGRGGSTRGAGKGGAAGNGATSTRGGSAARKPRVTKAAKLQMEKEKMQRENMAVLAAKPQGYPG